MRPQVEKAVRTWRTTCAAEITTMVLGGAWKPSILHELADHGVLRFGELSRLLSGLTDRVLTRQLRELEADGLLRRVVYPQVPPKVEYSLTELGENAQKVLNAMAAWGRSYAADHDPDR
ncbi:winged helix-turn-helix transcriptional regulator [Amycolatopsis silviterrae]|uniref:Winged helix-turn-helix transcriptional regulator n=1 Tax=Amycolatopsis silviterrae TaxID=1656914 RepID=A0ABW5H9W1_9PSEU